MKILISFASIIFIASTSFAQQVKIKDNPPIQIEAAFPLYIIDGLANHPKDSLQNKKILFDLDSDNIQSIEVVKGVSTALYGEAGKNGVIVITTKEFEKRIKNQKE
ncbi:MAG: TonB-dependent receptor plug domain-containing protein [Bacteroidota bacterium]